MKAPVEQTSRWEAAKSSCKVCVRASQTLLKYPLYDVSNQGGLLLLNNGLTSLAILIIYWFSFTDFTDLGRFKALFVELPAGFFSFSLMLSKQEPLKLQHVADLRLQALFGTVSILPRTQTSLSPRKFGRKGRRERENGRDVTSPLIFVLPMVPCASSPVTRMSLAFRNRLYVKIEAPEGEAGNWPIEH